MSGLENACFLVCFMRVQTLDVICNSLHPPARRPGALGAYHFPLSPVKPQALLKKED